MVGGAVVGVVGADWLGLIDLGIRRTFQPGEVKAVVDAAVPAAPTAPARIEPTTVLAAPRMDTARIAAMQRGVEHLGRQLPAAEQEVESFVAKERLAAAKGQDGLTYEQRLARDLTMAKAQNNGQERVRLEQALDLYHARQVKTPGGWRMRARCWRHWISG